jgi:hypothetical protein
VVRWGNYVAIALRALRDGVLEGKPLNSADKKADFTLLRLPFLFLIFNELVKFL